MENSLTEKIIELLPQIIENGPNQQSIEILKSVGVCDAHISEVFEMIHSGIFRASFYKSGASSEQFSSDWDDNPIFLKTIEIEMMKEDIEDEKEMDVDQLLQEFNDENNPNRDYALYDLAQANYPYLSELIEKVIFSEDKMLQLTAIQSVKKEFLTESLTQKLIQLYKETEDNTLISNLGEIFIECNLKQTVPFMLNKLESKTLMNVHDTIYHLGFLADENVIEILVPFKENNEIAEIYDENGFLECSAGHSIGKQAKKSISRIKKRIKKSVQK